MWTALELAGPCLALLLCVEFSQSPEALALLLVRAAPQWMSYKPSTVNLPPDSLLCGYSRADCNIIALVFLSLFPFYSMGVTYLFHFT